MVNVSYTTTSGDLLWYPTDDGSEPPVLYNLGDMAWSKSPSNPQRADQC